MYALFFHAHQKLDKVAYRHLQKIIKKDDFFPSLDLIINFDGPNGPDSSKLKRQLNVEQPWHFINPKDSKDTRLKKEIDFHYKQLIISLKEKDEVRSAFQAAWLAHALVDGLTPAHHYPYEKELEKLRGDTRHSRKGLIGRAFIKGETVGQSVAKSLKLIGPKGLLTTHTMFEAGAYFVILPLRLNRALPNPDEIARITNIGITNMFNQMVSEVVSLELYTRFYLSGWTIGLSQDVRTQLAPRMAKIITLAWLAAINDAVST